MAAKYSLEIKKLTIMAILLAIMLVLEYIDILLLSRQVLTLAICSCITYFVALKYGWKDGGVFYLCGGLLMLILLPRPQTALSYSLFFGLYGFVKPLLDRIGKLWLSMICKLVILNVSALLLYITIKILLVGNNLLPPYSILMIIGACIVFQIIFFVYDYSMKYSTEYIFKLLKL